MESQFDTHEVFNQVPPLEGYDVFGADPALVEAVDREGAGWARPELEALGALAGAGPDPGAGASGQRAPARTAHPRPLRQPDRRGRVPPGLPRADDAPRSATDCIRGPGPTPGPVPMWPGRPR